MAASENCTTLTDLTLQEVVKRINIGRDEFWGAPSTVWQVLFNVHCVVFIVLFAIITCWCGLFMWEKLQAWRKRSSFLYLLAVYCMMWSLSSVLQYVLLIVNNVQPPNQSLAVVTYGFEMTILATSMNGLLILAVYQYYRFKFHPYQSLTKYILFTGPALVIATIIIVTISTSIGSLAIVAIVVLILLLTFIGMIGTTSLVAMYTELWFRTKNSKSLRGTKLVRILIMRLLFRLASYIYLALLPASLMAPFIKLAANNDCIQETLGNRTVWLIIQTIIKSSELLLVTQCLNVPQKIQKLCKSVKPAEKPVDFLPKLTHKSLEDVALYSSKVFPIKSCVNTAYDVQKVDLESTSSTEHAKPDQLLAITLDICDPASTESPHQIVECIDNVVSSTTVEQEILPQASNENLNKELQVQSYVNNKVVLPSEKLECEFQDNQLLYSVFDELRTQFNYYLYDIPSLVHEKEFSESSTTMKQEILSLASNDNLNKELQVQSYLNKVVPPPSEKLECEFQDNQLLYSELDELRTQSPPPVHKNVKIISPPIPVDTENSIGDTEAKKFDKKEVEIISAHIPVDTENLIGDIERGMFDERGGVFHSYKHGVTVLLPAGAIPSGILAELKFAATLTAPIKLTSNKLPVSAIYWLCMDAMLQKPLEVRMPHFVSIEDKVQSSNLKFLKSTHSPVDVIENFMSNTIEGEFPVGESYGSLAVDHFCYYCIVGDKLDCSNIPSNKYVVVAMKQRQPRRHHWNVHICILPQLKTCIEKLKEQYGHDWKYSSVDKFSFPQGCQQLSIELKSHPFQGEAVVELLSNDKISKEDIDFQQYYEKDLEQLKLLMDEKLYPPRFKVIVQAEKKDFFATSKYLYFELTCGSKIIKGKLLVPGHDTFSESSSDSDCSLILDKRGSGTSGYRSIDSIEHLSDEDDLNSRKLQLRNLLVQTMSIKSKWFELGIALHIPINKLERLYDKYNDNQVKALIRVYRFWLADKNGLKPTWEKLMGALQDIKEYNLAICLENSTSIDQEQYSNIFHDDVNEPEKNLVMKHVRLELINLTALIPVLNKYNLLASNDNYVLLNYLISPLDRANVLLYKILPSKGPGAFRTFITCLQEEKEHIGHQELAKTLISFMKTSTKAMETAV